MNLNFSDAKLNALLDMAGKKVGKSPEELREKISANDVDGLLQGLDPKTAAQAKGLLSNPKAMEALMQNEQIQKLISSLGGKG